MVATYVTQKIDLSPVITDEAATKAVVDAIRATDVPLITGKEDAVKAVVDLIRSTDVVNLTALINSITNIAVYGLSLYNTTDLNHNVQVNTSLLQEMFSMNGSGWVRLSYHAPTVLAGTPVIELYDGVIDEYHLLAKHQPAAATGGMLVAAPAFFATGLVVQMSGDATHPLNVFLSTIQKTAVTAWSKVMRHTCYIDSVLNNVNLPDSSAPVVEYVVAHIARQLMQVDLTGLPPVASVTSAILRVYPQADKHAITDFHIHAMLVDWVYNQATWDIRKTAVNWGAGGGQSGVDYEAANVYTGNPDFTAHTATDFDITSVVNRWLAGTLTNNGLILTIETVSATNLVAINSKQADAINCVPMLVITI